MKTNDRIYLSSPHMGGTEQHYVQEAFDTNWISPVGPNIDGFEEAIADYTGCGYAAALSSGTAAIHLALVLLGVGSGDEVICSTFTFSASVNPIVYQGATPVLVDSESHTWNMCPETLEAAIKDRLQQGRKPKAIVLVHLYGMPSKMDEIMKVAEQYDIPVIEDAAESLGSTYKEKALGTFGNMGIYSFNGNKIITTSGGGALVSKEKTLIDKARFLATQAREPAPHYQHSDIGYNYRMSNIVAGIGRGQMEVLSGHVDKRRAIYGAYRSAFGNLPGIHFLDEPEGCFSNRWLSTLLIDPSTSTSGVDREHVRESLEKENIEARPLWKPMHLQPVFENCPYYGDGTSERLFEQGICLPSGSNMSDKQMDRVLREISALLNLE